MREPAFWWRAASSQPLWWSLLMKPLGAIYGGIAGRRMLRAGAQAPVPVICVGNFHVGGAGKTPTVIALLALLQELGETPFVLSRGYGGTLKGPLQIDVARHAAADVGDEPLLIARHAPVIVARDRAAGAALAAQSGASVVVMDDGFQNPTLQKDLSILVIDAHRGIGNGAVFPAGPLRAPLDVQLPRADALLVVGDGQAAEAIAAQLSPRPVLRARIAPASQATQLASKPVFAFAGIGDPERFFTTLRRAGIVPLATRTFADHHAFTAAEIADLRDEARRKGLTLLTTEKDLVRLGPLAQSSGAPIAAFPITMQIADAAALRALVQSALAKRRAG